MYSVRCASTPFTIVEVLLCRAMATNNVHNRYGDIYSPEALLRTVSSHGRYPRLKIGIINGNPPKLISSTACHHPQSSPIHKTYSVPRQQKTKRRSGSRPKRMRLLLSLPSHRPPVLRLTGLASQIPSQPSNSLAKRHSVHEACHSESLGRIAWRALCLISLGTQGTFSTLSCWLLTRIASLVLFRRGNTRLLRDCRVFPTLGVAGGMGGWLSPTFTTRIMNFLYSAFNVSYSSTDGGIQYWPLLDFEYLASSAGRLVNSLYCLARMASLGLRGYNNSRFSRGY